MVLACSVEIVSVIRDEYRSFKSNPANGHYGYAVVFHGADPVSRIDLEFPVTRLFTKENVIATTYAGQWFLAQRIAEGLQTSYDCFAPTVKLCVGLVIADPANVTLPGHPETVVKVKGCPGSQINIITYWVDIPGVGLTTLEVDPSDGSDGLDEYPEPARNPSDDPWAGNPPTSPVDPSNDPRDYGVGEGSGEPVAFRFLVSPILDGNTCEPYPDSVSFFETGRFPGLQLPLTLIPGPPIPDVCGETGLRQGFIVQDATGFSMNIAGADTQVLMSGATIKSVSII